MLQINTLVQQRMLGYAWLAANRSAIDIPAGIIVGISLTSTVNVPVAVSNISVTDDGLSVVLTQRGEQFASVLTTEENAVVPMTPHGSCVSAVIETGAFMAARFSFRPETPQYIRRSFLTVLEPTSTGSETVSTNNDTVVWRDNTRIMIDGAYLTYRISGTNGSIIVSIRDDVKALFSPNGADTTILDDGILYSINGVAPNTNGELRIAATTLGYPLTFNARNDSCIVIDSTVQPCEQDNYIDQMLSPVRAREVEHEPLDDAYHWSDVHGWVRDYKLLEGTKTNPVRYGNYTGATGGGVTLYELNPTHDIV